MLKTVSQQPAPVKAPQRAAYVTIRPDGQLFRWYRHTGFQGYTSQDAFLSAAQAAEAARSIASVYGVPYKAVSWNSEVSRG